MLKFEFHTGRELGRYEPASNQCFTVYALLKACIFLRDCV